MHKISGVGSLWNWHCSSDLFTSLRLCNHVNCHRRFLGSLPLFSSKISDSDGYMSSSGSSNVQELVSSNDIEVVWLKETICGQATSSLERQWRRLRGRFGWALPTVFHARFEREVVINEWFVLLTVIWFREWSRNEAIALINIFVFL